MTIGALDAASAYGRSIRGTGSPGGAEYTNGAGEGAKTSFGDMVSGMVSHTAGVLGKAERASIKQVAGKGDLIDVVTAIGAAETALDTMIAVRDRVVSAYGEIMRMQI
ncbi:flagellar hook-basal body complex protein FliE [Sphingobium subterraneum]|uniref:flagellar hook-basal body complex protein FliE n=1 Tax=Sphingobium subterraneum TaxID=627688 RepID=UPI00160B6FDB